MPREAPFAPPLCFQADRPLGKLAKWLRLLGFDTTWPGDPQPVASDEAAARILLARSPRGRPPRPGVRVLLVAANDPWRQLQQLVAALGIRWSDTRPFSRCIRCNQPLEAIGREAVRDKVPDYVWTAHENFNTCKRCGRIYWPGSHTRRSLERMRTLFHPAAEGYFERRCPHDD